MKRHHLTVGGQTYCAWTGCKAGMDIDADVGPFTCSQPSGAAARRAVAALAPHFRPGRVVAVAGPCPSEA